MFVGWWPASNWLLNATTVAPFARSEGDSKPVTSVPAAGSVTMLPSLRTVTASNVAMRMRVALPWLFLRRRRTKRARAGAGRRNSWSCAALASVADKTLVNAASSSVVVESSTSKSRAFSVVANAAGCRRTRSSSVSPPRSSSTNWFVTWLFAVSQYVLALLSRRFSGRLVASW